MATTIQEWTANQACAYCDSRIFEHDPICIRDCAAGCSNPTYFCNHACLMTYIDERDLVIGDACTWVPSS